MKTLVVQPYSEIKDLTITDDFKLVINKAPFSKVVSKPGTMVLKIKNCTFNNLSIENYSEINFEDISIYVVDCYIKNISIIKIETKNISVHFGSSIVAGIIDSENLSSVTFGNCIIAGGMFLKKLKMINISHTHENIFPGRWLQLMAKVGIKDFRELIRIKQSYHIYESISIKVHSNINDKTPSGLYIQHPPHSDKISRFGYRFSEAEKALFDVNLSISYDSSVIDTKTSITDVNLNSLTIKGQSQGKIEIERCKINNIYLHEFAPEKDFSMYFIRPFSILRKSRKFEIQKSVMDTAWFDNVFLDEYERVSFFRSKLRNATFTACNFPYLGLSFESFMSVQNIHYPELKAANYYKDQYEVFLQLKMSLESTGNFHEAQKLNAISSNALLMVKGINGEDKFILTINKFSNNHGLSIIRPFILLLAMSILLFVWYVESLALGNKLFDGYESDGRIVGHYFAFIDLTHRVDFLVAKEDVTGVALFVDFINKVLTGFFIYQLIAAFRRYGKV